MIQDLRVWLELEIPVIEDGNSFGPSFRVSSCSPPSPSTGAGADHAGADVQAHMIKELNDAYRKSNAYQNGCRSHYGDRLKLAQEWVKFPNLMDYPAAIAAVSGFSPQPPCEPDD
jgi:hypothetical protein